MKKILVIACALFGLVCIGKPKSSSVGARAMVTAVENGASVATAADYVQDGLLCMWDAIENAGWGVHDDTATHWMELISGTEDAIVGSLGTRYAWSDNALVSYTTGNTFISDKTEELLEAFQNCTFTIESITSCPTASHGWQAQFFNIAQSGQGYNQGIILRYRREDNGYCGSVYTGKYSSGPDYQISPIDALHTWAVSYDNGYGLFYGDGKFVGSRTATPDTTISSVIVRIGTSTYQFQGCYHSIRIYSRALTADEVEHNAQIDQVRFGI